MKETLLNGFLPKYISPPEISYKCSNRKAAVNNKEFVSDQIASLLQTRAISEHRSSETIRINPLSVAEGKKSRLILDLSDLNRSLEKYRIKFEDLSKIRNLLPHQGFMTCFDLRSGYHHVLIQQSFRKYLGFA